MQKPPKSKRLLIFRKTNQMSDQPKVTGIGGIFFFSENPEKTKEWYSKNLGLETTQWGSSFEFRNAQVENLRANGVTIVDEIATYEYGKFVHIMDDEGTKIELWEPIDSVFTAMGGKTTK